jgi:O-6-methylguanine DNA methyltransferase
MVDVYYSDIDTPLGKLWAARSKQGLIKLNLPCSEENFLHELDTLVDSEPEYRPSRLDNLSMWMEKYFDGSKRKYRKQLDLNGTEFQKKVWKKIYEIPYGKLTSYSQIAIDIEKPKAAGAVGNAVGANPISIVIPCHRVVWVNGGIGGFGGGLKKKRMLLTVEGIFDSPEGTPEKRVDLSKYF